MGVTGGGLLLPDLTNVTERVGTSTQTFSSKTSRPPSTSLYPRTYPVRLVTAVSHPPLCFWTADLFLDPPLLPCRRRWKLGVRRHQLVLCRSMILPVKYQRRDPSSRVSTGLRMYDMGFETCRVESGLRLLTDYL